MMVLISENTSRLSSLMLLLVAKRATCNLADFSVCILRDMCAVPRNLPTRWLDVYLAVEDVRIDGSTNLKWKLLREAAANGRHRKRGALLQPMSWPSRKC